MFTVISWSICKTISYKFGNGQQNHNSSSYRVIFEIKHNGDHRSKQECSSLADEQLSGIIKSPNRGRGQIKTGSAPWSRPTLHLTGVCCLLALISTEEEKINAREDEGSGPDKEPSDAN